jgi:Na+-driven multidrug efflux pump
VFVIIVAGLQTILQGIMKTLQVENFWKKIVLSLYIVGLGSAILLSYTFDIKLTGLWAGWGIGMSALLIYEVVYLYKIEWEEDFDKVREKYKVM